METVLREQQIRERAYAIWEGEGRPADRAEAHWLRAEAEIAREEVRSDGGTAGVPQLTVPSAKKRSLAAAPVRRRTRAS